MILVIATGYCGYAQSDLAEAIRFGVQRDVHVHDWLRPHTDSGVAVKLQKYDLDIGSMLWACRVARTTP